jgi:putative addiction module component (TIGR02574 family)
MRRSSRRRERSAVDWTKRQTRWDTLSEGAVPSISDEWLAEIDRRSAEYDAGLVQPIPWEQIRTDALRRRKSGQQELMITCRAHVSFGSLAMLP